MKSFYPGRRCGARAGCRSWGVWAACERSRSSPATGSEPASHLDDETHKHLFRTNTHTSCVPPHVFISLPLRCRYGRVALRTDRKMESSSTRSPVTWHAVASWYIMCSVLKDCRGQKHRAALQLHLCSPWILQDPQWQVSHYSHVLVSHMSPCFNAFPSDVTTRSWSYLSHEDESSVEDHQQSVLVVLQQNPEGTERKTTTPGVRQNNTVPTFSLCVVIVAPCWPDERGPAGASVQAAQVAADGCFLELLDVLQLFFSHVGSLSHEQLHQVEELLHRLQGAAKTHATHSMMWLNLISG